MLIKLYRIIEVETFKAVIELGRNEARDEIISVLMLARENGNKISAELICQELLAKRPITMGSLIIKRCKELELFDEENNLTNLGQSSIESGEIFIPERELFILSCTNDPLLPQVILDLEPQPPQKLHQEINSERRKENNESKKKYDEGEIELLPQWILNLEGKVIDLVCTSKNKVKIKSIAEKGQKIIVHQVEELKCELSIQDDGSITLSIFGRFNEKLQPPPLEFREVWKTLLGPIANDWDESVSSPKLRVRFGELTDQERNTFLKDIAFGNPSIPNYGNFEQTVIKDVPIGPKTQEDANEWANWLLINNLTSYQFEKGYQRVVEEISQKFSKFKVSLPSRMELSNLLREKLLTTAERMPNHYWFVQAPLDLNPGERIIE
ncbi:MAG: hypothetical protein ACTSRC_06200 [Candidatus Helarchaeota archaeon]